MPQAICKFPCRTSSLTILWADQYSFWPYCFRRDSQATSSESAGLRKGQVWKFVPLEEEARKAWSTCKGEIGINYPMEIRMTALAGLLLLCANLGAQQAPSKIGVINIQKALARTQEGQKVAGSSDQSSAQTKGV